MRYFSMALLGLGALSMAANAGPFRKRQATFQVNSCQVTTAKVTTTTTTTTVQVTELSTAQGAANYIARSGLFRHHGGHRSFEGIGLGATEAQAIANCCKPRFGGAPREIGIARMASGLFVAVCRW